MLQIARKSSPGSQAKLKASAPTHTVTYLPLNDEVGFINFPLISKLCFAQFFLAIPRFIR